MANDVVVVIGSGGIGLAIAKRQGVGRTVLLADFNEEVLNAAAQSMRDASYKVETQVVDVTSRESVHALAEKAASLGPVMQVINTAGLSPNMAPVDNIRRGAPRSANAWIMAFNRHRPTPSRRLAGSTIRSWMTPAGPRSAI